MKRISILLYSVLLYAKTATGNEYAEFMSQNSSK